MKTRVSLNYFVNDFGNVSRMSWGDKVNLTNEIEKEIGVCLRIDVSKAFHESTLYKTEIHNLYGVYSNFSRIKLFMQVSWKTVFSDASFSECDNNNEFDL